MSKKRNPHRGSSFDDFLREDGIYEEVSAEADRRVREWSARSMIKTLLWIAFGWTVVGLAWWAFSSVPCHPNICTKAEAETKPAGVTERLIRGVAE